MRSLRLCASASVFFAVALAGCSKDNPLPAYLKNTWGITINGVPQDVVVDADGTQHHNNDARITVDGLGTRDISSQTTISPQAQGGDVTLFVSNPDGSDERCFHYNLGENYITIGSQTKGVAIDQNPDGTYEIWAFDGPNKDTFLTAPNGFEALRIVEQYNEFKTISPFILLSAFAFAHDEIPEARLRVFCNSGASAAKPAVCEIFKEFCDCAACLVLNRRGACAPCPKL